MTQAKLKTDICQVCPRMTGFHTTAAPFLSLSSSLCSLCFCAYILHLFLSTLYHQLYSLRAARAHGTCICAACVSCATHFAPCILPYYCLLSSLPSTICVSFRSGFCFIASQWHGSCLAFVSYATVYNARSLFSLPVFACWDQDGVECCYAYITFFSHSLNNCSWLFYGMAAYFVSTFYSI